MLQVSWLKILFSCSPSSPQVMPGKIAAPGDGPRSKNLTLHGRYPWGGAEMRPINNRNTRITISQKLLFFFWFFWVCGFFWWGKTSPPHYTRLPCFPLVFTAPGTPECRRLLGYLPSDHLGSRCDVRRLSRHPIGQQRVVEDVRRIRPLFIDVVEPQPLVVPPGVPLDPQA